jgi:hypothetical protein
MTKKSLMSPEILEQWEQIIDEIDKKNIPIEFIKKIVLKLQNRKQKTINIQTLLKREIDIESIEEIVTGELEQHQERTIAVEFILDIEGIASMVQPQTDDLLKNL